MLGSARARAGVMLLGAVGALSAPVAQADAIWLAGYLFDNETLETQGGIGGAIGTIVGGAGYLMQTYGTTAAIIATGGSMVTLGTGLVVTAA